MWDMKQNARNNKTHRQQYGGYKRKGGRRR